MGKNRDEMGHGFWRTLQFDFQNVCWHVHILNSICNEIVKQGIGAKCSVGFCVSISLNNVCPDY